MASNLFGSADELEVEDTLTQQVQPQPQQVQPQPQQVQPQPQPQQYGAGEAGMMGIGEGGTMGFSGEIYGGLSALAEAISTGDFAKIDESYKFFRDSREKELKQAAQQQPAAYYTGEIGAGMLAPGGVLAKTGQKMSDVVKVGMGTGAAFGAGKSEANLVDGEVGQFAADVGESTVVGGLGAGVGKVALTGVAAAGKAVKNKYADQVAKYFEKYEWMPEGVGYKSPSVKEIAKSGKEEFRAARKGLVSAEEADVAARDIKLELEPLIERRKRVFVARDAEKKVIERTSKVGDKAQSEIEKLKTTKELITQRLADDYANPIDSPAGDKLRNSLWEKSRDVDEKIASAKRTLASVTKTEGAQAGKTTKEYDRLNEQARLLNEEIAALREIREKGLGAVDADLNPVYSQGAEARFNQVNRKMTLDDFRKQLLQQSKDVYKKASKLGVKPSQQTIQAIETRLNGLAILKAKGNIAPDAAVFGTVSKTVKKDIDFVNRPYESLKKYAPLALAAAGGKMGLDIGVPGAVYVGGLIGVFLPKLTKSAWESVKDTKKFVPAIVKATKKTIKKYGPIKLQQMGFYAEHLKLPRKLKPYEEVGNMAEPTKIEKWAQGISAGTQAFGIAGAGMVHAKFLETDPEYRKYIKQRLKEEKIPMTLLFNEKKESK